jgi:hypothetical protein
MDKAPRQNHENFGKSRAECGIKLDMTPGSIYNDMQDKSEKLGGCFSVVARRQAATWAVPCGSFYAV